MIPTPPPFTPQQRINNDFENYPYAQLGSYMLKALQNPSPAPKPGARVGWNPVASMFNMPPQHLQQMAGEVISPPMGRFLPIDPADPYSEAFAAQRYENAQQPGGLRAIQGPAPSNVMPIKPTTTKWGR